MPRQGRMTEHLDAVYAQLLEGPLSGPDRTRREWLGCEPDSVRRRASQNGRKVSISRTTRVRGQQILTLQLLPPDSE